MSFRLFPGQERLLHGGDWNPDQWLHEPAVIDEDFRLFPRAGWNVVTLGVFAWARLEPADGRREFGWLDRLMDRAAAQWLRVLLATPSAAPPLWLQIGHPAVRRVLRDGRRNAPGWRMIHCPTAPEFRARARGIAAALAERYARHPALAVWHISNEICPECWCDGCLAEFRRWVRARHGTLEAVNLAWWTAFWGHPLTDWEQIDPRDAALDGMALDFRRFQSAMAVEVVAEEVAGVRAHDPRTPVTTNLMGTDRRVNYAALAKVVDFVSLDSYPAYWDRDDAGRAAHECAFHQAVTRGLKERPWLQMETTASVSNWWPRTPLKRPGILRFEVAQAVANGADGVGYFQWRKSSGGWEKHHGAVVDHGGADTRVFREVAAAGALLERLSPVVGSRPVAGVAIVHDWESRWALEEGSGYGTDGPADKGVLADAIEHYLALSRLTVPVDVVPPDADFAPYRLVVLPGVHLVDDALAARLAARVAAGGAVLATCLTAVVDTHNRVHRGGLPGAGLRRLFGVRVEETDQLLEERPQALAPTPGNALGLAEPLAARDYADVMQLEGAEPLATYARDFYAGTPALTLRRADGGGAALWLGARLAPEGLGALHRRLAAHCGLKPLLAAPPPGVSASLRRDSREEFLFVLNGTRHAVAVDVGVGGRDLETGAAASGRLELPAYGVRVLRRAAPADRHD